MIFSAGFFLKLTILGKQKIEHKTLTALGCIIDTPVWSTKRGTDTSLGAYATTTARSYAPDEVHPMRRMQNEVVVLQEKLNILEESQGEG